MWYIQFNIPPMWTPFTRDQTKVRGSAIDKASFDEEVHLWHMINNIPPIWTPFARNQTKVMGSVVDHATFDGEVHLWGGA